VVNLSRRPHPDYESLFFDLSDSASWAALESHFVETLAVYRGERVMFIQNAHLRGLTGFAGEGASSDYLIDVTANVTAPLAIGGSFLRAVIGSGYAGEAGLVMLSSAAARSPYEGQSVYCAGKAAIEMWVRVVKRELVRRERSNIWVTAVRPGFVDTATTRLVASLPEHVYPAGAAIADHLESGTGVLDIDSAARAIWARLPTRESLLLFGEQVQATGGSGNA
jgi:NAD(P)-dependent dehydrogenase (short-subunit alcohol dehydrogenase family)